jgi:hypothetical protein
MAKTPSGRLLHPSTLLQMFKDVGYEEAILNGKARAGKPYKDGPGPPHQLPGTRSQTVPFYLMGHLAAVCHQYKRLDGSIGASGKPDPKMPEYRGKRFYCHSQPCKCIVCNGAPEDWRTFIK